MDKTATLIINLAALAIIGALVALVVAIVLTI